jgi:hypothetical protein
MYLFKTGKLKRRALISLFITFVTCSLLSAKPKSKSDLVKEEDGFYYGYGKGSSLEESTELARKDLVETALTATVRLTDPAAKNVAVSGDTVDERLGNLKAFQASKDGKNVTYRIKVADWEKLEKAYEKKLRDTQSSVYNKLLSTKNPAEKLELAASILNTLEKTGLTNILTYQEGATELLARKVENICNSLVETFNIEFSQKDTILKSNDPLTITVTGNSDQPLTGLKLKVVWAVPYVSVISEDSGLNEVISFVTTDSEGKALVELPLDEEYKNNVLELNVSTAFTAEEFVSQQMRMIDNGSAFDARYFYPADIDQLYSFVKVEGGKFTTGALAHDSKAAKKEKAREVELEAYEIAAAPVTNFQYGIYAYLTRNEETPEYFVNSDYNGKDQPVIGVSYDNALAYAEWLSSQLEASFRLPTDDEWEVAARAGEQFIYPWGDDDPSKGKKANYKGNGKYKYPSPVGAFETGINGWGLMDMSGNVWEWTSSQRNLSEDSTMGTVKGGSWMDGVMDLRISNYKNIEKSNIYPDVGIRLVKEVSK